MTAAGGLVDVPTARCYKGTIPRWLKASMCGGFVSKYSPKKRIGPKRDSGFKNYMAQAMRGKVRKHDRR